MIFLTGPQLQEAVDAILQGVERERDMYAELVGYLDSPNTRRICCLYGLRRTGKTTMMAQAVRHLELSTCLWVQGNDQTQTGNTMAALLPALRDILANAPQIRYIFIDELTDFKGYMDSGSVFPDYFGGRTGKKVVVNGTDSLGLFFSQFHEWYDRAIFLHTTYISYAEYHRLLGTDILAYIAYGGILKNDPHWYKYPHEALADNIARSIQDFHQGRNIGYNRFGDIIDRHELPSVIQKIVEYHSKSFVAGILYRVFRSHDPGSLVELMNKHSAIDLSALDTEETIDRIRALLQIQDISYRGIEEEDVTTLRDYLVSLDFLYPIPRYDRRTKGDAYIFTQPGVRYAQSVGVADALLCSEAFEDYTAEERDHILQKLREDIYGGILEDIVFYQTQHFCEDLFRQHPNTFLHCPWMVQKYQDANNREIDILLENFELLAVLPMEIQLAEARVPEQQKWLRDADVCKRITEQTGLAICNKVILYRGESGVTEDGEILYIHVESFLLHMDRYIPALLCQTIRTHEDFEYFAPSKQGVSRTGPACARNTRDNTHPAGDLSGTAC